MRENYRFSLRSKSLKNAQLHDEIMRLLGDWGEALNEQHMYCGGTDALLAIICRSICYSYKDAIEKHSDRSEW